MHGGDSWDQYNTESEYNSWLAEQAEFQEEGDEDDW